MPFSFKRIVALTGCRGRAKIKYGLGLGLAAAIWFATGPAAALQDIGQTVVVVADVTGKIEEKLRQLQERDNVYRDELISTGQESASKIVFADETELSVGPATEIVLDNFVYDPGTGAGTFSLGMTKGVLRFASGKLSNVTGTSYTIQTPSATIGIRGTTLLVIAYLDWVCTYSVEAGVNSAAMKSTFDGSELQINETGKTVCASPTSGVAEYPSLPFWARSRANQLALLPELEETEFPFAPPLRGGAIQIRQGRQDEYLTLGIQAGANNTTEPDDDCAKSPIENDCDEFSN